MKKLSFLILLLNTYVLTAQNSQEDLQVKAVIRDMFTAMQRSDTIAMRKLFHPSARLQTALFNTKTQQPKLLNETLDEFIAQVGELRTDTMKIEERITSFEIRVDEPMASVWAPYEFYINGKLSHTGVDAFQLFRSSEGWKIIQICDTRKRK